MEKKEVTNLKRQTARSPQYVYEPQFPLISTDVEWKNKNVPLNSAQVECMKNEWGITGAKTEREALKVLRKRKYVFTHDIGFTEVVRTNN